MDVLFNNRKSIQLANSFKTIQDVIIYLKNNELSEREELFVDGNNLYWFWLSFTYRRSGILVLVNDTDWEVLEKENTPVEVHYHFLCDL